MVTFAPWALLSLALLFPGVLAGQDVEGNPVLTLSDVVPIDSPGTFYSDLHPCPASCAGRKPKDWTVYSSTDRLALCTHPVLFDLAIYNPVDNPNAHVKLRACTPGAGENANSTVNAIFEKTSSNPTRRAESSAASCLSTAEEASIGVEFGTVGALHRDIETTSTVAVALDELQKYLGHKSHCGESIMFAHVNGTVAGAYLGSAFDPKTITSIASRLEARVKAEGSSEAMAVQLCGKGRNSHHIFGVAVDTTSNVAAVQSALRSWKSAKCIDALDAKETWENVPVYESVVDMNPIASSSPSPSPTPLASSILSSLSFGTKVPLQPRGHCSTTRVANGDNCAALASRCGISYSSFLEYNPDEDLCKTLVPGQPVCCSPGPLPDIRRRASDDGTCATHYVEIGDNCSDLAAANGLTQKDIEKFNNGTTWGWNGCNDLNAGIYICLSKGDPPMPAPISNAVCGPTKPGSKKPTSGSLEDMNPCPLNVCCNIWGQCGITEDFCKEERGPADNPGTSARENGCVSSCGVDITNNDKGPSSYGRVGYYESWNFDRDCLNLRAANANTDESYTHMHWAFAGINTEDWTVAINDTYNQWEDFKSLNAKRIISFGGWGFSTEPETYDVLRQAMSPANRATFAANVAKFLEDEGLDGVDFDWEYPGVRPSLRSLLR